jgi:hypothetical protein
VVYCEASDSTSDRGTRGQEPGTLRTLNFPSLISEQTVCSPVPRSLAALGTEIQVGDAGMDGRDMVSSPGDFRFGLFPDVPSVLRKSGTR